MQFVNDDSHYLNPRFSSELGFLNKPVFEMQRKIHALNKEIGSDNRLMDKQRLQLNSSKNELVADFKRQMNKEVKKNCPELELQAGYAIDVQLSDYVCNEVGMWCERYPDNTIAEAEQNAAKSTQDTRINWYAQMFDKNQSKPLLEVKNHPDAELDKD